MVKSKWSVSHCRKLISFILWSALSLHYQRIFQCNSIVLYGQHHPSIAYCSYGAFYVPVLVTCVMYNECVCSLSLMRLNTRLTCLPCIF